MAIGSPPPPEEGPRSNVPNHVRSMWFGGGLLLAGLVVVGAVAWRMLRSSDTPPSRAPPSEPRATAQAPHEPVAEDPTFSQRLLAAAAAAQRHVTITAHVAKESRELVKSLDLIGGFEPAPAGRPDETAALATGEFTADGSVTLSIPAAWPRLRALRIVRRDGTFVLVRDLALVGEDLDLGELTLPAGGAIGGHVRSRDGGPLEGARVALFDPSEEPLPAALPEAGALGVVTTGADGSFSFTSVPERRVRVEVSGVAGRANAVVEEAEIFGPPLEIALLPATSIGGRLVDAGGAPIEGGRLAARMAGPREQSSQRSGPTGRDGGFELDALAPGYYTLFATAAGFAPRTVARAHTDVEGLTLRLDRLASARLTIVNAPAELRTPVVWRTVEPLGAAFRRTSTAELAWCVGRELVVTGIEPGRQALEISFPGAAPIVTTVATFAANQPTELGTLSLQRGAELSLRVTDREGRPLRARVALAAPQWSSNAGRKDLFALDHDERVTDADGRCVWPDLPAGRRLVAARANGADASAEVEIPASGRVEVAPLVIEPAGAIAGRVSARKGPPLAGMLVEVAGVGATRSATTDIDGRYEVRGLPAGRYVVTVVRRDEAPPTDLGAALAPRENPTASVEVVVGETTPRDFDLEVD